MTEDPYEMAKVMTEDPYEIMAINSWLRTYMRFWQVLDEDPYEIMAKVMAVDAFETMA